MCSALTLPSCEKYIFCFTSNFQNEDVAVCSEVCKANLPKPDLPPLETVASGQILHSYWFQKQKRVCTFRTTQIQNTKKRTDLVGEFSETDGGRMAKGTWRCCLPRLFSSLCERGEKDIEMLIQKLASTLVLSGFEL